MFLKRRRCSWFRISHARVPFLTVKPIAVVKPQNQQKKKSGKTGLCRFLRVVMNELGRTRGRIPAIFPGNVADSCGQVRGYRRKGGVFFQDNVTRKR